ncbi:LIM and SH3 domain protein F42H10.3-like [Ctenocephalides felis]|nr:LIM and SH3 domain protein F42H10.3-like [Ctenocephalides felis]
MTLNMKTYKGYNKQPYCEAHIPKVKATTMAETPELKRIAENTKIQSNVKYHADFEKSKGKFTQVADDPETLRIKQNSRIISNVAYHGDLAKKAAMEKQRTINENGEFIDACETEENLSDNYLNNTNSSKTYNAPSVVPQSSMLGNTQHAQDSYQSPDNYQSQPKTMSYPEPDVMNPPRTLPPNAPNYNMPPTYNSQQYQTSGMNPNSYQNQSNAQYQQQQQQQQQHYKQHSQQQQSYTPNQNTAQQTQQMYHQGNQQAYNNAHKPNYVNNSSYGNQNMQMSQTIGKIADYDPVTDGPRNTPYTSRQSSTLIYSSDRGAVSGQARRIGSVADMDPVSYGYNAMPPTPTHNVTQQSGRVYRALYDYSAQDVDEVSFMDGDLIVNVSCIDEGWMTGTVQRTGMTGMLPANYVEIASI